MADKTTGELRAVNIGDLPGSADIYDDFKMPGELQGEAVHVTGAQFKQYAVQAVKPIVKDLDEKVASATNAGAAAQSALAGVREALNNLPEGSTLIVNDLTTGGTTAALSAEMGKVLNRRPNPNLLHNWYFANPVNQRNGFIAPIGIEAYSDEACTVSVGMKSIANPVAGFTGNAAYYLIDNNTVKRYVKKEDVVSGYVGGGYTIDRWKSLSNNPTILTDKGVKLADNNGGIAHMIWDQYAESNNRSDLVGRTVTVSVLVSEISGAYVLQFGGSDRIIDKPGLHTFTVDDFNIQGFFVRFYNNTPYASITMMAAKVELGDTQTLAHQDADGNWVLNEIPDYGEELAKCQRYFLRLGSSDFGQIGMGMVHADNVLGVWLNPPTVMRIRPTPTLTGKIIAVDSTTGTQYEVQLNVGNSINAYTDPETGVVVLYLTGKTTTLTPGKVYSVQAQSGGYVNLSADL